MPTYEFMCESCEKRFEVTLTIAERANAKVRCPSCGGEKVTPQPTVFIAKTSRFLRSEDGPTAVEYGVMLAVIIAVCILGIQSVGTKTNVSFTAVSNSMAAAS